MFEKSGRQNMSAEENKALVRRLLERVRSGWSPGVIEEFFAPSYRRYLNPTTPPLTPDEQRARANRLRAAFPDATATLEDILAEGDGVAYRLTLRGSDRGRQTGRGVGRARSVRSPATDRGGRHCRPGQQAWTGFRRRTARLSGPLAPVRSPRPLNVAVRRLPEQRHPVKDGDHGHRR